jgi:hypothetical protein
VLDLDLDWSDSDSGLGGHDHDAGTTQQARVHDDHVVPKPRHDGDKGVGEASAGLGATATAAPGQARAQTDRQHPSHVVVLGAAEGRWAATRKPQHAPDSHSQRFDAASRHHPDRYQRQLKREGDLSQLIHHHTSGVGAAGGGQQQQQAVMDELQAAGLYGVDASDADHGAGFGASARVLEWEQQLARQARTPPAARSGRGVLAISSSRRRSGKQGGRSSSPGATVRARARKPRPSPSRKAALGSTEPPRAVGDDTTLALAVLDHSSSSSRGDSARRHQQQRLLLGPGLSGGAGAAGEGPQQQRVMLRTLAPAAAAVRQPPRPRYVRQPQPREMPHQDIGGYNGTGACQHV